MENKAFKIIKRIIAIFIIYLIIDYINIPSHLGFIPNNINFDIFTIIFDAVIVSVLYVISFYYIENKQNEKDNNATKIVDVLLEKTYTECLDNLILLDNKEIIRQYIIPKVDGNKTDSENKVINNLQTLPFLSYDSVISLASNGYVDKNKLNEYLEIKKEYQYLVSMKITFFDLINPNTDEQKAMLENITTRDSSLKSKLKK